MDEIRILYVEDEEDDHAILQMFVEDLNDSPAFADIDLQLDRCSNSEDFQERMQDRSYHIVIADFRLGTNQTSSAAIRRAIERYGTVGRRYFVTSGAMGSSDRIQQELGDLLDEGVLEYVTKSDWSVIRLTSVLRQFLQP